LATEAGMPPRQIHRDSGAANPLRLAITARSKPQASRRHAEMGPQTLSPSTTYDKLSKRDQATSLSTLAVV
jgi:hypothetical protein